MPSLNASLKVWLSTQCQILGNVSTAMLVRTSDGTHQIIAKWPSADAVDAPLRAVLYPVVNKQRLHLERLDDGHFLLGQPLIIDGNFWGVLVLALTNADKKALPALLKELKFGQFWLQYLLHQQSVTIEDQAGPDAPSNSVVAVNSVVAALTNEQQQAAMLQLIASLLKENSLQETAITLVNLLASHLQATRVSLGLLHKHQVQLEAVSFSASFDARTQAMHAIKEAMNEAIEQGVALGYAQHPSASASTTTNNAVITRAHQQLQQLQQLQSAQSFLLRKGDSVLGAITLELDKQTELSAEQQLFLQTFLHFAGPIIVLRQQAAAGFRQLVVRPIVGLLQSWFGVNAWRGKLAASVLGVLLVSLFIPLEYRISADASLQTTERYLVVSPQDGYLGQVLVRPGDSVKKSAPLAQLNDEELRLERRKLASQVQRYRQAYDAALANSDRVEAAIANAQMDQASIQLRLLDQQLQRTQLLAPIDGIIVSNDISQNQGAPIKQGDILFELAAANDFIVQLFVDERDISAITPGQQGQVKLTSLPNSVFAVRVHSLTPISEVRDGRNYFRVELNLVEQADTLAVHSLLRPGMTGTGKITAGKRALGWILFHDLWHWLRLSLW